MGVCVCVGSSHPSSVGRSGDTFTHVVFIFSTVQRNLRTGIHIAMATIHTVLLTSVRQSHETEHTVDFNTCSTASRSALEE